MRKRSGAGDGDEDARGVRRGAWGRGRGWAQLRLSLSVESEGSSTHGRLERGDAERERGRRAFPGVSLMMGCRVGGRERASRNAGPTTRLVERRGAMSR